MRTFVRLLIACISVGMISALADEQIPQSSYSHLVYPHMRLSETGTLHSEFVLHRIDPLTDAAEEDARRVISSSRQLTGNGIQAVQRGKLYVAGYMDKTSRIDVATGTVLSAEPGPVETLLVNPQTDNIIFTMPQFTRVRQYDFTSQKTTELVKGSMQRSHTFATHTHSRIALSPSGHQLATATFAGRHEGLTFTHPFNINIVNLQQNPPESYRLKPQFTGGNVSTGGGNHVYAPAMFWTDEETLLVAAPPTPAASTQELNYGEWFTQLHEVNVNTSAVRLVCDLPFPGFSGMTRFDPDFWRRDDGALMMRSMRLGDYRIDLDNAQAVADRHLSTHYELRGDILKPSLWTGDEQLAARVNPWDVSVSPDGRQIVWMVPLHKHQYSWTHAEKSFLLYSKDTGTVSLGTGRFDLAKSHETHPVLRPPVHWLTSQDMQTSP